MRGSGYGYARSGGKSLGRWPQGKYWTAHDDLTANLIDRAEAHAKAALQHWTSDDVQEMVLAAFSAGSAVELMAKAHLANISPVLLAERADLDTLLHLLGQGDRSKVQPSEVRTISATTALLHARRLNPEIAFSSPADDLVFRVRNAAVHLAIVDEQEVHQALCIMVRIIDSLLVLSRWPDRARFWGNDLLAAADALADEAAGQVRRRLESKLAGARHRLADLTATLTKEGAEPIRSALAARQPWISIDHDERVNCPVCVEPAWLVCAVADDTREVDTGEGLFLATVGRTAWPEAFNCNVCGLELDQEEIGEVDELPHSIPLDLQDLDWEPEEDQLR